MFNVPDRKDEEPQHENCPECNAILDAGEECEFCKAWCEEEIIRRSDDEEAKADLIIQQISKCYPKAEIHLTMPSGNKYIKK